MKEEDVMNLSIFEFFLLVLASFRLTRLIVFDQITAFLRKPFLKEVEEREPDGTVVAYIEPKGTGLRKWFGELISCYWCAGIWSAAILLLLYYLFPVITVVVLYVLAIAGFAAIIETVINKLMD